MNYVNGLPCASVSSRFEGSNTKMFLEKEQEMLTN